MPFRRCRSATVVSLLPGHFRDIRIGKPVHSERQPNLVALSGISPELLIHGPLSIAGPDHGKLYSARSYGLPVYAALKSAYIYSMNAHNVHLLFYILYVDFSVFVTLDMSK